MSNQTLGEKMIARVDDPKDRARLAAMVPDPRIVEGYAERILPGGRTEDELYRRGAANGRAVLLFGPAGSGKTLSPIMYAARHGAPVAVIEGHNGFDPETPFAVPHQNPETKVWEWTESDAMLIWRYGAGVIVIDEIGRIPSKSQSVLFPLLDDRRRITLPNKEVVRRADDVLVVATTNPPSYAGVSQMDPALWDRCAPVMSWGYDPAVEKALLTSPNLIAMAKDIRERSEFETPLSTRQLVEFEELVSDMGWGFAQAALIARYAEYEQLQIEATVTNWGPKIAADLGVEYGY